MRTTARWAVPSAVAVAVVGGALLVPAVASAAPDLAPTTPQQLLADVAGAQPVALSGTVVQTSDLGLPQLPTGGAGGPGGGAAAGADGALAALLGGTTTARVWTDGDQRSRVAVVGRLSETDVVRDGRTVTTWRSGSDAERDAVRVTLPEAPAAGATPATGGADGGAGAVALPATPEAAAAQALAAVDPTTEVSLAGTATVAGRDARLLALVPRDAGTLVGRVEVAVDAETSLPLRVQVFARTAGGVAADPAASVGFTDLSLAAPSAADLDPGLPAGTAVREVQPPAAPLPTRKHTDDASPQVVGEGWDAVVVARAGDGAAAALAGGSDGAAVAGGSATAQVLERAAQRVSGDWGSGRVLTTALVSVLVTDDGRVLAGAVPAAALEAAAASTR